MKDVHHKKEEDDISEPEYKNKWGWYLYKVKFWTLLLGYLLIFVSFIMFIKDLSANDALI
jgi:uncharacterized membrane protein (UPF0182 family)